MRTATIGLWQVDIDVEATRAAYARLASESQQLCTCATCRNFRALGAEAFPEVARELFEQLGINRQHPAEFYQSGPAVPGHVPCGGFFHFVGLLRGGDREHLVDFGNGFSYFLYNQPALVPKTFELLPVVQLEFNVQMRWVLEDPCPD